MPTCPAQGWRRDRTPGSAQLQYPAPAFSASSGRTRNPGLREIAPATCGPQARTPQQSSAHAASPLAQLAWEASVCSLCLVSCPSPGGPGGAPLRNRTVDLSYHGPPAGCCNRHTGPEQPLHRLALAAAGHGKPSLAALCPPKCPPKGSSDEEPSAAGPTIAYIFDFRASHLLIATASYRSAAPWADRTGKWPASASATSPGSGVTPAHCPAVQPGHASGAGRSPVNAWQPRVRTSSANCVATACLLLPAGPGPVPARGRGDRIVTPCPPGCLSRVRP
jgi:hypothetical protein